MMALQVAIKRAEGIAIPGTEICARPAGPPSW